MLRLNRPGEPTKGRLDLTHKTVRVRAIDLEFLLDLPEGVSVVSVDETVDLVLDVSEHLLEVFPESAVLKYELSDDLGFPVFVGVYTP